MTTLQTWCTYSDFRYDSESSNLPPELQKLIDQRDDDDDECHSDGHRATATAPDGSHWTIHTRSFYQGDSECSEPYAWTAVAVNEDSGKRLIVDTPAIGLTKIHPIAYNKNALYYLALDEHIREAATGEPRWQGRFPGVAALLKHSSDKSIKNSVEWAPFHLFRDRSWGVLMTSWMQATITGDSALDNKQANHIKSVIDDVNTYGRAIFYDIKLTLNVTPTATASISTPWGDLACTLTPSSAPWGSNGTDFATALDHLLADAVSQLKPFERLFYDALRTDEKTANQALVIQHIQDVSMVDGHIDENAMNDLRDLILLCHKFLTGDTDAARLKCCC